MKKEELTELQLHRIKTYHELELMAAELESLRRRRVKEECLQEIIEMEEEIQHCLRESKANFLRKSALGLGRNPGGEVLAAYARELEEELKRLDEWLLNTCKSFLYTKFKKRELHFYHWNTLKKMLGK